jgi:hypothetical protein
MQARLDAYKAAPAAMKAVQASTKKDEVWTQFYPAAGQLKSSTNATVSPTRGTVP